MFEKVRRESRQFKRQFAKRTLNLVTSGFGLVAALAWNEVIKEFVREYIQPFAGEASGLISLLIYAVIVTVFAVLVTYNLTRSAERK